MIKLSNVSFSYKGTKEVLRDINLEIKDGEFVLLLGESGSGKTSLTRVMNFLIPRFFEGDFRGDIQILGRPQKDLTMVDLSSMIGSVFQNPRNQFFTLDTTSEIAFNLENQGIEANIIKKRVLEVFNTLKISHLMEKNLYTLSAGQMQMLAIASALALNPRILILDEPSANLDRLGIANLVDILGVLKRNGTTIIISEHRLYYLKDLVDRAIYIENGEIKEDLPGHELYKLNQPDRLKYHLRSLRDNKIILKNGAVSVNDNSLELKNLAIGYRDKLIDKIDLKINAGEVIGITGSNGGGKSTLLNTIAGLRKELAGEILFNNKRINRKSRQKICALVMQEPGYQFFMESVHKELTMGQANYSELELDKLLDSMDLINKKERNPLKLSGGEKQRLAILISLLDDKKILLFDEPSSGLDYKNMKNIAAEIKKLQAKGKIIIIISHDHELLSEACTRILYVDKGKIVESR